MHRAHLGARLLHLQIARHELFGGARIFCVAVRGFDDLRVEIHNLKCVKVDLQLASHRLAPLDGLFDVLLFTQLTRAARPTEFARKRRDCPTETAHNNDPEQSEGHDKMGVSP